MSAGKAKSIEAGLHVMGLKDQTQTVSGSNIGGKFVKVRIKSFLSGMTVEPVLLFYILPSMMITIAVQNLNLEKACRVNLNFPPEHCDALTNQNASAFATFKDAEQQVQTLAAYMTMIKNIVQSVIPGTILLFLGAWSDKHHQRIPCMLVPILGDIVMVMGLLLCTFFFYELPIQVNSVFEAFCPAITGSWFAMFAGVYSYISDVSTEEERTIRIGTVNMITNISMCAGTALSGILYQAIGFYGVYTTALVMYLVALSYGYFYLHDPLVDNDCKNTESRGFFRDFFQIQHVTETFKTAVKSGNSRARKSRVCGILFLFMVITGPFYGEMNVVYFFVRFKFGWDSVQYSFFSTFQFVTSTLGTVLSLTIFTKFLKLHDSILGMISCSTKILASLVYTFSSTAIYFYFGAVVEMLNGTSFIAMRALITKLVLPEELGKINSLFGIAEAVIPLIYGPLYSQIYTRTINYLPGCFYLVGGGLTVPAIFIFLWLYIEHKKDKQLDIEATAPPQKPLLEYSEMQKQFTEHVQEESHVTLNPS